MPSEILKDQRLDPSPEPEVRVVTDAEVMHELDGDDPLKYFDEDALIEAGLLMCFGQFGKAKTMFSIVRERAKEKAHAALIERALNGER